MLVMFFIIGTVMGSFYHVVATRMSNDESIIYPSSHCTKCNYKLKWYENIPIISYILYHLLLLLLNLKQKLTL